MKFADDQIIVNGDMSADVVSEWININQIFGYFIQAIYTGAPDGVLSIEISGDITDSADDVVNFDTLGSSTVIVSAAGITSYNVTNQFCKWFRVRYEFSSGTGSLNVNYNAKG